MVLLILAGVSLNTLFGESGIINSATSTQEKMEIASIKERIEIIKTNWEMERILYNNVTVDDFWQDLKEADIIEDVTEEYVREVDSKTEDGVTKTEYEIKTKDGYLIDIIIRTDENEKIDITIEEVINNEKALARVKLNLVSQTTNSITVKADILRAEGKYIYSYRLEEETKYTKYEETTDTEVTITGLNQNQKYYIKVEVSNKNGQASTEIDAKTVELENLTITIDGPNWKGDGTASVTLSAETSFTIQYQIDGIEDSDWIDYKDGEITGLQHNQTIYAQITDGVNNTKYTTKTIKDGTAPSATISATTSYSITSGTTTSISATVTHTDSQSGVNITSCKYIFNTSSTALGTTASKYTDGTFSSNGQKITKTVSKGTYYLHVLTVDVAGNAKETISGAITVTQKVTGISLNKTSGSVEKKNINTNSYSNTK